MMIKSKLKKGVTAALMLVVAFISAAQQPTFFENSGTAQVPVEEPKTEDVAIGSEVPIDMYEFALLTVAIMLLLYFAWKYRSRLAKA